MGSIADHTKHKIPVQGLFSAIPLEIAPLMDIRTPNMCGFVGAGAAGPFLPCPDVYACSYKNARVHPTWIHSFPHRCRSRRRFGFANLPCVSLYDHEEQA